MLFIEKYKSIFFLSDFSLFLLKFVCRGVKDLKTPNETFIHFPLNKTFRLIEPYLLHVIKTRYVFLQYRKAILLYF